MKRAPTRDGMGLRTGLRGKKRTALLAWIAGREV